MFRVQSKTSGNWVTTCIHHMGRVGLTDKKPEARIFEARERYFWEDNNGFEIVPLAEDELLARQGQPQLPGFEDSL